MSGIYIHIPFCRTACLYCDFHFSTNLEKKAVLVDTICREIAERKDYLSDKNLRSIYFGGGTPSVLTLAEVCKILNTISKYFTVEKNAETTFELNPEDADKKYLSDLKSAGLNRLSVGVQSFTEEELRWMNRMHTAAQSAQCIIDAKTAGFENISIDLIYGSRFQDEKTWKETLNKVFAMEIPHISSYNLTIEGKTKLNNLLQKRLEPEIDSELSSREFDILMDETEKNGYEHYEISNFCKPGFMAVHNANYWRGLPYLGVGPAAHSYNGISRRFNVRSNTQYIQSFEQNKKYFEEEELTEKDKYNEYILTRLRTSWGCNLSEIENLFGEKFKKHFLSQLEKYGEMIDWKGDIVSLNKKGKHFADGIASDLFY